MIFFTKLIKLLFRSKISFSNPPVNSIVLFDDGNIDDFKHVLKKRKFFVLQTRDYKINKIFINF